MDPKLKKWIRWIKEIHDELLQLVIARDIFWSVQDLIRKNNKIQKPSSFYQYLGYTYISFIVMGIRRQIKVDTQSISFARLLSDIAGHSKKISRKFFNELYKGSTVESLADKDFDRFCESAGDLHISQEMVINDLSILRERFKILEKFADKKIAHLDRKYPKVIPTFRDIDDAIDILHKLYIKYHHLFYAHSVNLMPIYQYDWQAIFDYPWRLKNKNQNVLAEG